MRYSHTRIHGEGESAFFLSFFFLCALLFSRTLRSFRGPPLRELQLPIVIVDLLDVCEFHVWNSLALIAFHLGFFKGLLSENVRNAGSR